MNTKKDTKKIKLLILLTIISVSFYFNGFARAANVEKDEGPRYFVKSKSSFWKNALGSRHEFDNGFTADISGLQLALVKIFGLEIESVELLHILPPVSQIELDLKFYTGGKGGGKSPKDARAVPSDQTPWGIETAYNDATVESTSGGAGINVAVLDTGVFKDHLDLENRIVECRDFTNNRFKMVNGKCDDKNGHGTHISGTILADGGSDNLGIYGVAPEANLFAYKVCGNNGSCWADDIAYAIRYATDSEVKIINLSLGTNNEVGIIRDAINYATSKGVLVVASAGNDGPYFDSIDYPAAYINVLGIGAIDVLKEVPDWSSRGKNSTTTPYVIEEKDVEFGASGANVESAWKNGGYAILSGTSMAAPHVSGLAAKFWQEDADATREYLHQIAIDIWDEGDDDATGFGLPQIPLVKEPPESPPASESLELSEE